MNASRFTRHAYSRGRIFACLLAIGLSGALLAACQTTHQVSETTPADFSGFLGNYSMLQKGSDDEANYLYIDKSVKWSKYTKAYIKPVELWKSADPDAALNKMSPEDQQLLVNYFYTALVDTLKKEFQIVSQPGPDVLVIHAAITGGRGSKPVLNLISSVMPVGLVISYTKQAITGTGSAVGVIDIEVDFTDGASGQRVAALADARAGTKAWRTKFDGTWGDAKLAFEWWAERLNARFELIKRGNFSAESL
jgi:hypothetical protein